MTVDQSGENVLFVVADGYVEAHVQIRYQGDPARFAWLVPMPTRPEVRIGSQPLFDALLSGSRPVYGIRTVEMSCDGTTETTESTGCSGDGATSPTRSGIASEREQTATMDDPIGETVGSFDVTYLEGYDTDGILAWLMENDFQLPDRSAELIAPYVAEGSSFVAVRLTPGANVREIHPIVFRYPGERPAIPIQLTAVAATNDMRIRTFFLGEGRMVPSNFRHVEVNSVRLDWPTFASNYETVVARAVDETGDGLGFVTEYAGSSERIDPSGVYDLRWESEVFARIEPMMVIEELMYQGQMSCDGRACTFDHPLVLPLLRKYLPAPAGTVEASFYGCLSCNRDRIDENAWDGEAFAAEYEERVVAPGLRARDMLAAHPYLTRMLSMISPDEMTTDPGFHERTDLPEVAQERWAERTIACGEATVLRLPDGYEVIDNDPLAWPGANASMPYAARIEMVPLTGAAEVVLDVRVEIEAQVQAFNEQQPDRPVNVLSSVRDRSRRSSVGCRVHPGLPRQSAPLLLSVGLLVLRRRHLARRARTDTRR